MSERKCSVEGCDRVGQLVRGLCRPHYQSKRRAGAHLNFDRVRCAQEKTCTSDGCSNPPHSRGMCDSCYRRWRLYGSPAIRRGIAPNTWKGATCLVEGCNRKVSALGLCGQHRIRQRRGQSLEPFKPVAAKGAGLVFLQKNASFDRAECLIWPFGGRAGYKTISWNGRSIRAHRLMCVLAHGDPPFEGAEAAHSCGKGYDGCVNPRHLYWATREQNIQDNIRLGTISRGERHARAKLTEAQVKLIYADARTLEAIARDYGCTSSNIGMIKTGRTWSHVTGHKRPK